METLTTPSWNLSNDVEFTGVFLSFPQVILLMVDKKIRRFQLLRLVVEIPLFTEFYTYQVVVWDFCTINSTVRIGTCFFF